MADYCPDLTFPVSTGKSEADFLLYDTVAFTFEGEYL